MSKRIAKNSFLGDDNDYSLGFEQSIPQTPEVLNKELPPETNLYGGASPYFSSFLQYLVATAPLLPDYWTPARDTYLRKQVIQNGFLSSSVWVVLLKLFGLPFKVASRDSAIGAHNKLATSYDILLQTSLNKYLEQFIYDLLVCDNGAFLLIEGLDSVDQPLSSPTTGLKHLDSNFCQLTGNPDFPVVYWHSNGSLYPIHESRIIHLSLMKSPDRNYHGQGLGFASRCFLLSQHLLDVANYEAESLGSRSAEELIWATGATSKNIEEAFKLADISSDNVGLTKVGKRVYMGLRDPQGKVGKLMLKNLPENFDKRNDVEITLTLLAMASGGQSTWFYDSVKSGSTRASAQESTKLGESKIITWWLQKFSDELEIKFVPPFLRIVAGLDEQDYDGTKAKIRFTSAQTRNLNLQSKTTNVRVERELQLQRNEITPAQFELLELEDGRLDTGLPIYALFQTNEQTIKNMLSVTSNPLDFEHNNPEELLPKILEYKLNAIAQAQNGKTILTQSNARKVIYALEWLEEAYTLLRDGKITPSDVFDIYDNDFKTLDNPLNLSGTQQQDTSVAQQQVANKPKKKPVVVNGTNTNSNNSPNSVSSDNVPV